jgi:3-hydroxyisobutyrate dehydrogenase-like beta-hydroxyacid dehydrogenase
VERVSCAPRTRYGRRVAIRTLAVVSTGAMGSALAGVWLAGGVRVVATASGRSERTHRLAERAGVELLPDLDAVVAAADAVVSVVPPGRAAAVARDVAAAASRARVTPLFADLNAIAPRTVRDLDHGRLDLVDGSISGPPPLRPDTTTVYLSGRRAGELADVPSPGLDLRVVGLEIGLASAVKMSTASVYKGTVALLAHALAAARHHGVLDEVLDDLRGSYPQLVTSPGPVVGRAAAKSPRYVDEMREIAASQREAGLTPALFDAMAIVYGELARSDLAGRPPEALAAADLESVLASLSAAGAGRSVAAAMPPVPSADRDGAPRPRGRLFGRGRGE